MSAPRWYRGPWWAALPGGSRAWVGGAAVLLCIALLLLYSCRPDPEPPVDAPALTREAAALRDTVAALRGTVADQARRLDSARAAVRATSGTVTQTRAGWADARASKQDGGRAGESASDSVPVLRAIIAEQAGYIARLEAAGDSLAAASAALQRDTETALTLARVQLDTVALALDRLRAQQDSALAAERAAALDAGHAQGFAQGRRRGLIVGAVVAEVVTLLVLFVAK